MAQGTGVSSGPRVVLGMPVYNGSRHLPEAMDSILHQTFDDFALVVVDDASIDGSPELVERYAALDPRVHRHVNRERLGMIANWRRCFELARQRFPEFELFAWVSDHDSWHPRWLEVLVRELDTYPEAVLAYPRALRLIGDREDRPDWRPWLRDAARFDTGALTGVRRVRAARRGMFAGSMVYGLYRAADLERCGVFRAYLEPDRLLLLELATRGAFRQAPETLYYRRRTGGKPTRERQRVTLFPGRPPWTGRLTPRAGHVVGLLSSRAAPPWLRFGAAAVQLSAVILPPRRLRLVSELATRSEYRYPTAAVTVRTMGAVVRPRGGAPMLEGLPTSPAKAEW